MPKPEIPEIMGGSHGAAECKRGFQCVANARQAVKAAIMRDTDLASRNITEEQLATPGVPITEAVGDHRSDRWFLFSILVMAAAEVGVVLLLLV